MAESTQGPGRDRPRTEPTRRWSKISRFPIRGRARCWCASSPAASATPISRQERRLRHRLASRSCSGTRARHRRGRSGRASRTPQVGDHVILAWRAPCGNCRFCLVGQPNLCAASLNAAEAHAHHATARRSTPVLGIGTFCTHTVVHAEQAIPIDADLPPEQMSPDRLRRDDRRRRGALFGRRSSRAQRSRSSAAAASATSVIQGAQLAGATTIIAVDVDPRKLEWAKQFGATHTVNAREGDAVAQIKELTGGNGVNYSFEAVGQPGDARAGALLPRPGRHLRR